MNETRDIDSFCILVSNVNYFVPGVLMVNLDGFFSHCY